MNRLQSNLEIRRLASFARTGIWLWLGLIQALAGEMTEKAADHHEGLVKWPESAGPPKDPGLLAERNRRLELARKNFGDLKAGPEGLGNQGYQVGLLLAPVLLDDSRFVAEVLDAWFPASGEDMSGTEMASFANGLISGGRARDIKATMETLGFLDWVWNGSPPPVSPDSADPIVLLWNAFRSKNPKCLENPELWRQTSALSPKLQARIWVCSSLHNGPDFAREPELAETLRDAAKGSEIIRTALEWHLQDASINRGLGGKADVNALLAFPRALKAAGVPPEEFARLVCRNYTWTTFILLENPGVLIAETPVLLDGLRTLPGDLGDEIIQIVASCEYLWSKDGNESDVKPAGAARFGATGPLLEWVLTRVPESSLSAVSGSQMSPHILQTDDARLLALWLKALGKAGAGNVPLIMGLLEKGRVAEAVALDPPPGVGLFSPGNFTAHMEQLVARLRSDPSLQAFHLTVRLSMLEDAPSPEAPVEIKSARQNRLTAEFDRMSDVLSAEERADFILSLGISGNAENGHARALDERAAAAAAAEFRTMLSTGKRSAMARLYVRSAFTRAAAGDLSGIGEIATAIGAEPIGEICDDAIDCEVLRPVVGSIISHANNTDLKFPKASIDIILDFAKALAGRQSMRLSGSASRLVYLAATDDASLAAGMERCGLKGVKPAVPGASDGFSGMSSEMLTKEIRVALLHPSFSKILLAALSEVTVSDEKSPLVPLLGDQKLRAGITPEMFVRWNRDVARASPDDLKLIRLYVTESRDEFDMQQRIETEALLDRLGNSSGQNTRNFRERLLNSPWKD